MEKVRDVVMFCYDFFCMVASSCLLIKVGEGINNDIPPFLNLKKGVGFWGTK